MPIVKVTYRPPVFKAIVVLLADELPSIVAEALTCDDPKGQLSVSDVEIEVKEMGPDIRTNYDLRIIVEANEYPERRRNLEQREHQVLIAVRKFFASIDLLPRTQLKGWVWIRLSPGEWAEI